MALGLELLDVLNWQTAAIAALVVLFCAFALPRPRGIALRLVLTVAALTATFGYFQLAADREHAAKIHDLQARLADLSARAVVPGSALSCLDGDAGEAVETACEKAIFARPETAAAAVVYVTARLSLLADARRDVKGGDALAPSLASLRRALELDRYGIAAHVLATREGCSVQSCPAFAWVDDAAALKANLQAKAFDAYVARHAAEWNRKEEPAKPPAEAPQANAAPSPPAIVPFSSRYDFPSAASIPAVSIMNAEPPRPPEAAAALPQQPAATADQRMPMPPKRPQTQGAAPR